jgi:hypothetical protein
MFATLENYNRGNLGILEKPAAVEMLLKCRERLCEFIEIRETECYEMRPVRPRETRQVQPLTQDSKADYLRRRVLHFRVVGA